MLGTGGHALRQHRLEELAQRMLGRGHRGLHATLRRALLAQMQLAHRVVLDRRQVHDGIALVAVIADHQATTSGRAI
jgi:hypothetical protein